MEDFSNCDTFKKEDDVDENQPKLFCIGLKPGRDASNKPPPGQFGAFIQTTNEQRSEIEDSSELMETDTFSGFKGNRFSNGSSRLNNRGPNHRRSKAYE